MLKKRIIPLLLLMNDRLVKTINFNKFKDVGNPISNAKIFNDSDADELILLNINRNNRVHSSLMPILKEISKECFVPISAGGGISSIEDATDIIKNGADKIVINSICYNNYSFIKSLASKFGRQAVVASIDVKKIDKKFHLFSECGTLLNKITLEEHLEKLIKNDVGEIMITSINCEGTMEGPDHDLIKQVSNSTNVPIIYSGGVGNYDHIKDIFQIANISAVACGSLFNFTDSNPIRTKSYLKNYNINLRIF
tara:strand:- start:81 stop:839 length:759 start_codon:yes stop_codon:yes gene_type:complete